MNQKQSDFIKNLSREEAAGLLRFAPIGHPLMADPFYEVFMDKFRDLGGMSPEVSKFIDANSQDYCRLAEKAFAIFKKEDDSPLTEEEEKELETLERGFTVFANELSPRKRLDLLKVVNNAAFSQF